MVESRRTKEANITATRRYKIRVVERAVHLLGVLADGKSWKLSDISEAVEINSSTIYRLLATLSSFGYVQYDERTGTYRLGLACLELARSFFEPRDIRQLARPDLESLRDRTTETVHLGILDHWDVVYLEKLHGLHAVGLMASAVGGRLPSYCTGVGKALLAYQDTEEVREHFEQTGLIAFTKQTITSVDELIGHLKEIRNRGFALDKGEHDEEVRCVAVPVHGMDRRVVASISVSAPADRLDLDKDHANLIEAIRQTAEDISRKLGG